MYSDNEIIAEWQSMIKLFKSIDHTKEKSKEEYLQLIELAKINVKLTPRQREGIIARCNNAMSGEYYKQHTYTPNEYDTLRAANKK